MPAAARARTAENRCHWQICFLGRRRWIAAVGLPFCCGWPEIDSVPADFHSNIDKIGPVGGNVDDATGAGGGSLNIVF